MSDPAWKQVERRVADFLGAKRNRLSGSSGRPDQSRSDSTHPDVYVETKHGAIERMLNAEGRAAIREAGKHAALEGKHPMVAIHPKGKHGFWMLIHSADFDAIAAARETAKATP